MSDTIYRQEAIDAFDGVKVDEENCTEYDIGYNDGIDFAVSRLSVLPSAQPEVTEEEIKEYCLKRGLCIVDSALLKKHAFVQPERNVRAWWCVTPDGELVCSNCYNNPTNRIILDGELIYDMTPIKKRMRYCPNCGAKMVQKGEWHETD